MLVLAGSGSRELLAGMGVPQKLLEGSDASHGLLEVGGRPVLVAVGSGLHHKGYTLIADEGNAGELWKALTDKVGMEMVKRTCTRLAMSPSGCIWGAKGRVGESGKEMQLAVSACPMRPVHQWRTEEVASGGSGCKQR